MTKELAKAMLAYWGIQAANHPFNCACGKNPKGVCMIHHGKTEQEYNDTLAAAEE